MDRAVLLDSLGTLVELEPPWERIGPAVVDGLPEDRVRQAFLAEMAYYRDHAEQGRDAASLTELRERCAAVLSRELDRAVGVEEMMAAIRFRPYPDAGPALASLRDRGLRLVCVSNWDCSLGAVLDRVGLGAALDGVVTSASAGARKPDPGIFRAALEIAGCDPGEALHVGDTSGEDVAGARAARIRALLIDRRRSGPTAPRTELHDPGPSAVRISSLSEIVEHLDR